MSDVELLEVLGLARVAAAPELLRVVNARLRPPQQAQLLVSLRALQPVDAHGQDNESFVARGALERLEAHFDRKLDVKDELERFLLDLLKMHHFVASGKGGAKDVARDPRVLLLATTCEHGDREQLFRVFQTLRASTSLIYCRLVASLPPKYLHGLLCVFANELPELLEWMKWLASLKSETAISKSGISSFEVAVEFFGKCIREQCLPNWTKLLKPLESRQRFAVIEVIHTLPVTSASTSTTTTCLSMASPLKKLSQFLETTGMLSNRLLELDVSVQRLLPMLLDEFPTVTLQFLLTKFGTNFEIMEIVTIKGLQMLGKDGLLHLLESLTAAMLDSHSIETFLAALFRFKRLHVFLALYFRIEPACQVSIIYLAVGISSYSYGEGIVPTTQLFDLLLASSIDRSINVMLRNMMALPVKLVAELMCGIKTVESADDNESTDSNLTTLGECLDVAASSEVLTLVLPLYLVLSHHERVLIVAWLHDVPDMTAAAVYRVLYQLHANQQSAMYSVLEMLAGLKVKEKRLLCTDIMQDGGDSTLAQEQLLLFLAKLPDEGASRRKMLHLFRNIPRTNHNSFLLLLRTQPSTQQTALIRLMRSLPTDAISRLLQRIAEISSNSIDALFELLMLVPKAECPALAKLSTSASVQADQLETLVTVASDMKNQAASRELVMFASDLPPDVRTLFFQLLSDKIPEKGVLLRMMSLSSRVDMWLLCQIVRLLYCMDSWEVRSAFVEQLRSLEQEHDIQSCAEILYNFDSEALRWAVMLQSPFSAQTRVAFCKVVLLIQTSQERRRVFAKLKHIPKYRIGDLIAVICEPLTEQVSANFLRVIGVLRAEFLFQLLSLLANKKWWVFVDIMADTIPQATEAEQNSISGADSVNAVASVLVQLVHNDAYLSLFRCVLERALSSKVPLDTITSVALHFIHDLERLVALLRYSSSLGARQFGRESCIPLFFRVLAHCSQPELVFSVCRVVDEDDAIFALSRLDRMLQTNDQMRQEVSGTLCALALEVVTSRGVDTSIIHAFFNFVHRYKEIDSQVDLDRLSPVEHVLVPRHNSEFARQPPSSTPRIRSLREQFEFELTVDDTWKFEDDNISKRRVIPQTSPPSYRRVALERHVRQTRPESEEFPRKRSTRKPWWEDTLVQDGETTNNIGQDVDVICRQPNWMQDKREINRKPPRILPSVRAPQAFVTPAIPVDPVNTSAVVVCSDNPDSSYEKQNVSAIVNQVEGIERAIDGSEIGEEQDMVTLSPCSNERRIEMEPQVRSDEHQYAKLQHSPVRLSRSESAPETLELRRWKSEKQRAKYTRGLCGGFGQPLDFHVDRDVAVRALHQQCDDAYNLSAERIRFSKTPAAQAKIMQARVRRAMNQRQLPKVGRHQKNPLLRTDVLTVENATCALALAEQTRSHSMAMQSLAHGKSLHSRRAADGPNVS